MKNQILFVHFFLLFCFAPAIYAVDVSDSPFIQEIHRPYPIAAGAANDVRAVAADKADNIWAATKAGVYFLAKGAQQWRSLLPQPDAGPAFDLMVTRDGVVLIGVWNGVYRSTATGLQKVTGIDRPVAALCETKSGIIAFGPDGLWRRENGKWRFQQNAYAKTVRTAIADPDGGFWLATGMGLYHQSENGFSLFQNSSQVLTPDIFGLDFATDGSLWIGGLGGVTIFKNGEHTDQITPADGLPSIYVQSVTRAPNGTMWVGTKIGVARYDGQKWSVRHSRRWLLHDDVRDVAFDSEGTAWIATAGGVSAIKRKRMTLAEKADYFHKVCMTRHVREPGLVEKCQLTVPGDTSKWQPRDDDNDGQYTAMYLAMESLRFAATKDEKAKEKAKKAFEALQFLQTVTATSGFVARTVVPVTWKKMFDPNRTYTEPEWADIRVHNPREKRVAKRWRRSADGKWLWKGDTSSDEITGHMFGYLFYYDLVADRKEKKRVSDHVCRIVDYIIAGGYVLKDIDGKHTKWGVWSPEKLNHDPDWRAERGINSVEILSYLKLAYHVSEKKRYQKEYEKLLYKYGYIKNIAEAKTLNPAWRTHIDDELLALAFPCLLLYEDEPSLKRLYRKSLDRWYSAVKNDNSPFFNLTYAMLTGDDPQLARTVSALRATPLDLVRWRIDNSKREDIHLVYFPEMETLQTDRLLPPDEAGVMRWDKNPWSAVVGDGGYTESDGVFWLLPYWMGRYYGFIRKAILFEEK